MLTQRLEEIAHKVEETWAAVRRTTFVMKSIQHILHETSFKRLHNVGTFQLHKLYVFQKNTLRPARDTFQPRLIVISRRVVRTLFKQSTKSTITKLEEDVQKTLP